MKQAARRRPAGPLQGCRRSGRLGPAFAGHVREREAALQCLGALRLLRVGADMRRRRIQAGSPVPGVRCDGAAARQHQQHRRGVYRPARTFRCDVRGRAPPMASSPEHTRASARRAAVAVSPFIPLPCGSSRYERQRKARRAIHQETSMVPTCGSGRSTTPIIITRRVGCAVMRMS